MGASGIPPIPVRAAVKLSCLRWHISSRLGRVLPGPARNLFLRQPSRLVRAETGPSCGWHNGSDDFVAVRGNLDCQKTAFSVAHDIKSYAHALRECLGVIAGFLLGHEAGSCSVKLAAFIIANGLERRLVPILPKPAFCHR